MSPKLQPEYQLAVAEEIKRWIIQGDFPPESRLPSFNEMEKHFPYSKITLRHAVELLKREGFIISRKRQGLYVHPRPPHLSRIGFALPDAAPSSLRSGSLPQTKLLNGFSSRNDRLSAAHFM